jgi:branched-chain amino acid transport system ATP-binding protein
MLGLDVRALTVTYGEIVGVQSVSFGIAAQTIGAIIGSNGAGKTTILNAISGLRKVVAGTISFGGDDVTTLPPHARVQRGIAQVPEGRRLFGRMTVGENLRVSANWRTDTDAVEEDFERAVTMFPRIKERLRQHAGTLSGGEQQMLAIGRALMSRPKLMLLDEPSMGLAPQVVDVVFEAIRTINQAGVTILLVEQNAFRALEIAQTAFVIKNGVIAMQGAGADLLNDNRVRAAYLGVADESETVN